MPLEQVFQLARTKDRDRLSVDAEKAFLAELCQRARESFASTAHLSRQHPLCSVQPDLALLRREGTRAAFQKPVGQAGFEVFLGQIIQQADEDAQMHRH